VEGRTVMDGFGFRVQWKHDGIGEEEQGMGVEKKLLHLEG